ncbi:MAG TPA: hypothetical protein VEX68_19630 [Bryobacteraceae bacterium]|nr:hypothetical protein [Bryobacteraceae bacterium]
MSSATAVTRILKELGIALENPPIVGDLLEEYASGRSNWWLWRQALIIVLTTGWGDLWHHKLLGLRAAATGLLVILTAGTVKSRLTAQTWADGLVVFWVLTLLSFMLTGWVVGLTHRRYKAAMLIAFVFYALFAKAWVYTSHFQHYWNMSEPYKFFVDAGLTLLGLVCVLAGGVMPRPALFAETAN